MGRGGAPFGAGGAGGAVAFGASGARVAAAFCGGSALHPTGAAVAGGAACASGATAWSGTHAGAPPVSQCTWTKPCATCEAVAG
jgi:hypothetical protein